MKSVTRFQLLLIALAVGVPTSLAFGQSLPGDINGDGVHSTADIDAWDLGYAIYQTNPTAYAGFIPILDMQEPLAGPSAAGSVSAIDRTILIHAFVGVVCGDANGDNVVNAADLNIVALNLHQTNATWADGDFDGNNIVDQADVDCVTENWSAQGNGALVTPLAAHFIDIFEQQLEQDDGDLFSDEIALANEKNLTLFDLLDMNNDGHFNTQDRWVKAALNTFTELGYESQ